MAPLLFLNVGWMSKYQGLRGDSIKGGGAYVSAHGYGHEIFNFKPFQGRMYGFARTPNNCIQIEKLGAPKGADYLTGVLVIWVAKSRVIGWYKDATVYRHLQDPPKGSERVYKGDLIKYNVTAKALGCRCLDRDGRLLRVPRAAKTKGGMGRYLWYADEAKFSKYRTKVLKVVQSGGRISGDSVTNQNKRKSGLAIQLNYRKRIEVERTAVETVGKHFSELGYVVESVEKDCVGWDLNIVHNEVGMQLKVEVKGLTGNDVGVEMTHQEYQMMRKYKDVYRICVVTNCLDEKRRTLSVFAYDKELQRWVDNFDRSLSIKEVTSARLRV